MNVLSAILVLFFQASQPPDKWECCGDSEPLPKEALERVTPGELKERMVSCAVPRLTGNVDAQGTIMVEVQIDEGGNVRCARVITALPIMRRAALDAAKKWSFEPLKVDGKAKPYASFLPLVVHWNMREAEKQCPKEKRRA
jgi:TonB family protein